MATGQEKPEEPAGNSGLEGFLLPWERESSENDREQKVCSVCGDQALAHNFGALTCETYKAFFRRNALKKETAHCTFDGKCTISKTTRRHCSACRLKKCFAVGMKPQMILDDSARKARMTLRQKKREERQGTSNQDQGNVMASDLTKTNTISPHTNSVGSPPFIDPASSYVTEAVCPADGVSSCRKPVSSSTSTTDSPGVAGPSGVALFSMGSTTPFTGETTSLSSTAMDIFFQQSLAGVETSSQGTRSAGHVAAELWARPGSLSEDDHSWSLPQYGSQAPAQGGDGSGCPSVDCVGAQAQCPASRFSGGITFQHVPRDDLPSDIKQYWRLSSDERASLTHVSHTYQDTMMKAMERDPDKTAGGQNKSKLTMDDHFFLLDHVLHLCVRFAKALPEFWQLEQPDQISILRASSMRCCGIAASAMCVPERGVWLSPFGDVGPDRLPADISTDPFFALMFNFCCGLKSVAKTDATIYGLLHCITLFDPGEITVEDNQTVNILQDKYLILLKHYLQSEFSYQHTEKYLGALMEIFLKLRSLGRQSVSFFKRFSSFFKPLGAEFLNPD